MSEFGTGNQQLIGEIERLQKRLRSSALVDEVFDMIADSDPVLIDLKQGADLSHVRPWPGFYVFSIRLANSDPHRNSIDQFMKDWRAKPDPNFQHWPAIVKKRITKYDALTDWVPLYLGKSENTHKRIEDHIRLPGSSKTFALKLMARRKTLRDYSFMVKQITFEKFDGMQILLTNIERYLREKVVPIVGRQ